MFYPNNRDAQKTEQIAKVLRRIANTHEGEMFIEGIKKERSKLHSQMEKALPDLFPMMQGKAQAYTEIIDAFEVAESTLKKLNK